MRFSFSWDDFDFWFLVRPKIIYTRSFSFSYVLGCKLRAFWSCGRLCNDASCVSWYFCSWWHSLGRWMVFYTCLFNIFTNCGESFLYTLAATNSIYVSFSFFITDGSRYQQQGVSALCGNIAHVPPINGCKFL